MVKIIKKLNSCSAADDGSLVVMGGLGAVMALIFGAYYALSFVPTLFVR